MKKMDGILHPNMKADLFFKNISDGFLKVHRLSFTQNIFMIVYSVRGITTLYEI